MKMFSFQLQIFTSGVKVSDYKEDRTPYIKDRRTIFSENSKIQRLVKGWRGLGKVWINK